MGHELFVQGAEEQHLLQKQRVMEETNLSIEGDFDGGEGKGRTDRIKKCGLDLDCAWRSECC